MENGRLFRMLAKLGIVNERPEFGMEPTWSETGDRYLLKLFRDHLFHQVTETGAPWIDMAHIVQCLNKVGTNHWAKEKERPEVISDTTADDFLSCSFLQLDAGVPEKVCLMSRDEQNILVVSYAELKKAFAKCFGELANTSARQWTFRLHHTVALIWRTFSALVFWKLDDWNLHCCALEMFAVFKVDDASLEFLTWNGRGQALVISFTRYSLAEIFASKTEWINRAVCLKCRFRMSQHERQGRKVRRKNNLSIEFLEVVRDHRGNHSSHVWPRCAVETSTRWFIDLFLLFFKYSGFAYAVMLSNKLFFASDCTAK